jgi:hypothetical protein
MQDSGELLTLPALLPMDYLLFLLSQAHQELTKHEAQHASRSDGDEDSPPSRTV